MFFDFTRVDREYQTCCMCVILIIYNNLDRPKNYHVCKYNNNMLVDSLVVCLYCLINIGILYRVIRRHGVVKGVVNVATF